MRIWRKFKTLAQALPSLQRKTCWNKCNECDQDWKSTETIYVHMIINESNETRYICDNCLNKIE